MKRVRVLKEMPFAKVGQMFEKSLGTTLFCIGGILYTQQNVDGLIGKWLEWVEEEKSLEEKLESSPDLSITSGTPQEDGHYHTTHSANYKKLSQLATDHFKEKFDEAAENQGHSDMWGVKELRKTMFGQE